MTEEIVQGSDAWKAIRLGRVTASRVADVIAKTKSGPAASRANYQAQLIAERLTSETQESYQNAAMQWGIEKEPDARASYEFRNDVTVELIGFVVHPTIPMSGASPDGLVGTDGLVEFKCPLTATHIETLLGRSVPGKYITQCQWQMACKPERKWCDYVSFDPRMPETMSYFVSRVHRDNRMIADLEAQVREFLSETERKLADLNDLYARQNAA